MEKTHCFKSYLSLALIVIPAFTVCSAWADDEKIKQLDLDQDGKIAIKEAVADPVLLASFGRIDTDGDGLITRLELERANYVEQKAKILTKTN